MFKTESSFLPDSDPGQIDYGIEYNVYDVTPDVSIDFVSFTTEESEGESGGVEYLSTINQFALLLQAFQALLIVSRCCQVCISLAPTSEVCINTAPLFAGLPQSVNIRSETCYNACYTILVIIVIIIRSGPGLLRDTGPSAPSRDQRSHPVPVTQL